MRKPDDMHACPLCKEIWSPSTICRLSVGLAVCLSVGLSVCMLGWLFVWLLVCLTLLAVAAGSESKLFFRSQALTGSH